MTSFSLSRQRGAFVALTCVAALGAGALISGCGSSSSDGSDGGSGGSYSDQMASLVKGEKYSTPSTSGPKPEKGKNVWVLSCDQRTTNCNLASAAMMAAGKQLGWNMKLVDWGFDPSKAASAIKQATAAKADGILTYLADCEIVKAPLTQAKDAGIKLVSAESLDCPTPVYDAVVTYGQGSFEQWVTAYGKAQAQTILDGTDGKADVIALEGLGSPSAAAAFKGFQDEMKGCPDCKVTAVKFGAADVGPPLQQKVQQALVKNPNANAIFVPADAYFAIGALPALRATGRLNKVFVGLGEGDPAIMDLLRSGKLTKAAGVGIPEEWEAYAAVSDLNRVFAGQGGVNSGIGLQAFTAEENVPKSGPYQPPVDYKSAYLQSWGLE